jgi:competence protein ComEC
MNVLKFPLPRVLILFVLGILFAYYLQPNVILSVCFLGVSFILFFKSFLKHKRGEANQNQNFGIILYILFFSIGIITTIIHDDRHNKNHFLHNNNHFFGTQNIEVCITDKLKNSKNYNRYIANITKINDQNYIGKIIVNIEKDVKPIEFITGTRLKINDHLLRNFKTNNPNQFDYGKHLEQKGIYGQVFTELSQIKKSDKTYKSLGYYTSFFRNKIVENLKKDNFKKEELAVVMALILGQQQEISSEIIQDYQYAGAVHILSVSGLHIGFIMLFITFLLKPLPQTKRFDAIRLTIILLSLWLFAVVAGLAPSVVRSTTMFSFIAVGMFLNREVNSYHTLLLSAFVILFFEPLFLFDIGFQLSYIAVFFILYLEPILRKIWTPKSKVIAYLWGIITVSFAAQIGTLPISLYYFHQFPGLFFVTNLVLIPSLTIIMFLGVLLVLLAFFNIVPSFLLQMVEKSITLMNLFIHRIATVESFIIDQISMSFLLQLALYFSIFAWISWIKKPNYKRIMISLCSILLMQTIYLLTSWYYQNKNEFIVFNLSKNNMIVERNGKNMIAYFNDDNSKSSIIYKTMQSYATGTFCKNIKVEKLTNTKTFNNKKILVIDAAGIYKTSITPDILILINSPKINLERVIARMQPKQIVADGSNYKTAVEQWEQTCIKTKIPFHSTYEKGFYSLKY